ncbi:hypothetical protein [Polyangium aurulentum]|uniref:hypothetical protein n=1 Tax=Polyangium aurulentum TaxID=2567896 RepID=UPI0010AECABB|nr:hypothetical protein [Polyangium aurulentum]UQA59795.1 hypothetical protein E8A73_004650 [Polyangium aurulentum]
MLKNLCLILGFGLTATVTAAVGCSGNDQNGSPTSASSGTGGGGGNGGSGIGGDLGFPDAGDDAPLTADAACAVSGVEANFQLRPIDIIFTIDNSGSMEAEIVSTKKNITDNLAAVLDANKIDYRVIMLSQYGNLVPGSDTIQKICVSSPLGSAACEPLPAKPTDNPPHFYHYSARILSTDSLCRIIDTFDGTAPDDYKTYPEGWKQLLRPESFKVFVEITDDFVDCTTKTATPLTFKDNDVIADGEAVAVQFDQALRSLSPEYFGTEQQRNYTFFSIVGLRENMPVDAPYPPDAPLIEKQCPTSVSQGLGYQALSKLTGAGRFPVCQDGAYNVAFQKIAETAIVGAKATCEFDVPPPPQGQTLEDAVVKYTPSNGDPPQQFEKVADASACTPTSYYVEPGQLRLCPEVCKLVQADNTAKIEILFVCNSQAN